MFKCAVAIAPVGCAARDGTIKTIGVAFNDSAESDRALELARHLAAESNAELSALEPRVEADARFGQPVDELARYSQSVDLLVLGSHRYTPYDRFVQQSAAQQLANAPAVPLLVLQSMTR
jgi:nucleotide-binding universal stress UspA family protein